MYLPKARLTRVTISVPLSVVADSGGGLLGRVSEVLGSGKRVESTLDITYVV